MKNSPAFRRISTLGLIVATASIVTPSFAASPAQEEAAQHYERGRELFDEGSYDAALLQFERAYKLAPTYKVLYNIAQVDRQLNDYARAFTAFDQYLREGGNEIPSARQAEVREELAKLGSRVAHIQVKTNATEGDVLVDDAVVGKLPLDAPLFVNVGRRKLTIASRTEGTQTRVVELVGGDNAIVDIEFVHAAPVGSAAPSEPLRTKASFPTVGWIVTAALGVGAIVTGIVALEKKSDNSDAKSTFGLSNNDSLVSSNNQARGWGIANDVFLGGTVVAAAVSGYFTIRYFNDKNDSAVRVGIGPGSAFVGGHF